MNTAERIAQKIKDARKKRGLTQKEVAAALGIKENRYAHYEKGRAEPSVELLYQICCYYGESFDDWLGIADASPTEQKQDELFKKYEKLPEHLRTAVDAILNQGNEKP